jgi:hypothetical protein
LLATIRSKLVACGKEEEATCKTRGVSHWGLAVYIKNNLREKEE